MTYNEAYNKIIEAYFKDEIKLNDSGFCFCGILNGGTGWKDGVCRTYTEKEFIKLEVALFSTFPESDFSYFNRNSYFYITIPDCNGIVDYEEKLFAGMSAALDVLKQIHIERGEVIDEVPVFTKRNLAHV